MKFDLTGYPYVDGKQAISLFGSILTITDCFDAITSPRKYRKHSLSPDRALKLMTDKIGKDFDPLLLKAFINMMGAYPIGTVVKLDSGELGIVEEPPGIDENDLPKIILIKKDESREGKYIKGEAVDLSIKNSRTGKHLKKVIESFHPGNFGIQPAVFLTRETA
ncbi:MAG: hypothetical protein K9L30_13115 [Desulfobacterales bacterium]|nr:hypothetical protein [Desulfobacterales bacterium]